MLHTTGRTWLWKQSLEYARDNPVLGIGPMNFACLGPEGRVGRPHNLAMQIVSEWGIPALGILLSLGVLLALRLFHLLRNCKDPDQPEATLSALLVCGILSALMLCAVDGVFITPASQIAASLVGGWLRGQSHRSPQSTSGHMGFALAFLVSATACSLLLLPFGWHEIQHMPAYRQVLPLVDHERPRLWQAGRACSVHEW